MTTLQPSGSRLRRLFAAPVGRTGSVDAAAAQAESTIVRLLDSPKLGSATPIQQRLLTMLHRSGIASFTSLVHAVADDLYAEELRMGAGVLDIGLFGSRLFHNDVSRELWAGDGMLWRISKQQS